MQDGGRKIVPKRLSVFSSALSFAFTELDTAIR